MKYPNILYTQKPWPALIYSRNIVFFVVHSSSGCLSFVNNRLQQYYYFVDQSEHPSQISNRFYVITMEFLSLSRRRSPWPNVPSGEEQGDTAVFAGYFSENSVVFNVVVYFYAFSHDMTLTSQMSNASKS